MKYYVIINIYIYIDIYIHIYKYMISCSSADEQYETRVECSIGE